MGLLDAGRIPQIKIYLFMKRAALLLLLVLPVTTYSQDLIKYVDPLIGTAPAATISAKRHSESISEDKGQTFPGVGRPFGMTQWTPETRTTELKCISPYYYNDRYITGFRGSHWMSGSCTQDYGSMTLNAIHYNASGYCNKITGFLV